MSTGCRSRYTSTGVQVAGHVPPTLQTRARLLLQARRTKSEIGTTKAHREDSAVVAMIGGGVGG